MNEQLQIGDTVKFTDKFLQNVAHKYTSPDRNKDWFHETHTVTSVSRNFYRLDDKKSGWYAYNLVKVNKVQRGFKKSDIVRRKDGKPFISGSCTAIVSYVHKKEVWFEHGTWLDEDSLELDQEECTPHKHKDIIIAWANGLTIQMLDVVEGGEWVDANPNTYRFTESYEYRIKPVPTRSSVRADEIKAQMKELQDELDELGE